MTEFITSVRDYLTPSHIITAVYLLNLMISFALVFFDRSKSSVAVMAWIMVLFALPVIGLILYVIFSQNISRLRIFRMSADEQAGIDSLLSWQKDSVRSGIKNLDSQTIHKWGDMIEMNLDYSDALLTDNESVEVIYDGREMFRSLCEDIRNARYSIKACYFIVKNDETGREFLDLLTAKAREGVKVRLLLDALGSVGIGRRQLCEFRKAGGECVFFFKPLFRMLNFRINYRNHRKLVIIDNEKGYIGGFNIAREYLGMKKRFGYWRDTQMIIRGNALITLNARFYSDWRYASKEKIDLIEQSARYAFKPNSGTIPIQIISCGPESDKEEIKRAMIKMINKAERSIYIQTPYLVPDSTMLEALGMAARSGVDVRIMIPCMPDHPFVYRTTLYNAGILISEGAKIYIYRNGFLHAKTLTVDGEVCTTGSCNFDIRSFRLNFESNAFVYDAEVTEGLNRQFEKDMEYCTEYTEEDRRNISLAESAAESISRLLTEIL